MKKTLVIKPLSVNDAWRGGPRYQTNDYRRYARDIYRLLGPCPKELIKGELSVRYIYYLHNYTNTDTSNLEKCLTDVLVKGQYIKDDRYIKEIYQRKEKLPKTDPEYIEIEIRPYGN